MRAGFALGFALLCLVQLTAVAGSTACIDVRKDCGARGDGTGDDTSAFVQCIAAAHASPLGCLNVPAGTFPVTGISMNASNVRMMVDAAAVLRPPSTWQSGIDGLIVFGSSSNAALVHNVSVVGVGGQFTIDCTLQRQLTGSHIGAIRLDGNVKKFEIGNVRTKMAHGAITDEKGLNTNALAMGNVLEDGISYHPTDGHVYNVTNTGSWDGYGLVQVQSAENVVFEHLDSTGGVTLRLETGVQKPGSFVGNITGRHLVCRSGHSGFLSSPHAQKNGNFSVFDVTSYSCFFGINIVPGYVQHNATEPGYFGNGSMVHNVVAYYG